MFPYQDTFPHSYIGKKHYPGTCFPYITYSVGKTDGLEPCALIVVQDGANGELAAAVEKLRREGRAPDCLVIGIHSGWSTTPDGEYWLARSEEYNAFSPDYSSFLIDEFIPHVVSEGGYNVSPDPDAHVICGASSGAVCAFIAAWFRPDYFRRLYLSSPAFLSMEKGDELLSLIRKAETKPFRIVMEHSEDEPDAYFGDLRLSAETARAAFEFAGYDYSSDYYPGEDHCSRFHREETLCGTFARIFEGYGERPVAAPRNQPRLDDVVLPGEGWTSCRDFPDAALEKGDLGAYGVADGRAAFYPICGGETVFDVDFSSLREVALSANRKLLYAADAGRGCLYKYVIGGDGVPGRRSRHGMLHILPDFRMPGAYSLCVDDVDRVYAATELGIQCVTFNGLVEAVLEPPAPLAAVTKLAFGGEGYRYLYASTEDGRIFRRKMEHAGRASVTNPPEDYMKKFVY
ncbi:MAG: hypothetical protein IJU75_04960 [Clostridia bacterium]|nr:hypothetical protein [Clostridia bacterium]